MQAAHALDLGPGLGLFLLMGVDLKKRQAQGERSA